jgi:hypothetical protein
VAGLSEVDENEKAISPDGQFAMICPLRDTADTIDKYPRRCLRMVDSSGFNSPSKDQKASVHTR